MQYVYDAFLVIHFIGLAMLIGGFLVQVSSPDKTVNRTMLEGALVQLISGFVMVGIASAGSIDETMNNQTVGIKTAILIVITVLAFIGRRRPAPQVALWGAVGGLAILNVLVAVFMGVTA
jgi:uncharacterized membrane protein